jgi:hypothetical protein
MQPCKYADDIQEIKADVKEIKSVLLGNQYHPGGLIKDYNRFKKRFDSLSRKVILYIGIGTGIIIVIGWIFTKLKL